MKRYLLILTGGQGHVGTWDAVAEGELTHSG